LDDLWTDFPWVHTAGLSPPVFPGTLRTHGQTNVVAGSLYSEETCFDIHGFMNFTAGLFISKCSSVNISQTYQTRLHAFLEIDKMCADVVP